MGYTDLVNQFVYKQPLLVAKFDALGENDAFLKNNGWSDSVKAIFFQASVPTGWTLVTGHNNRFLRVVNNAGGNVGGVDGGTQLVSSGLSLLHTHATISQNPHTHTTSSHSHFMDTGGGGANALGATYVLGVGDQPAECNSITSGGEELWRTSFGGPLDADASSSAGGHSHTPNNSLSNIVPSYIDVIIGQKNTSTGYLDMTNSFNHNDKIRFELFGVTLALYGNDVFNRDRLTPSGTASVFFQAAAVQGWSKLVTQSDKALRVVSGAGGGTGGAWATATPFTLAHTHSTSSAGTHNHTTGAHRHNVAGLGIFRQPPNFSFKWIVIDGSNRLVPTNGDGTVQNVVKGRTVKSAGGSAMGTDPDHSHTFNSALSNVALAYFDCIQCSKNSTGAPYSFEDLTSTMLYKKLVSRQKLDKFAKNDEYIRYHTMPAGAIMSFYQSSVPIQWILISTQHDKVLRVTSGAGGGSGGTFGLSGTITLNHSHTIPSRTHTHTVPSHSHAFETVSQAAGSIIANRYVMNPAFEEVHIGASGVFGGIVRSPSSNSSASTSTDSHDHGGASNSALSNIAFAYSNVILCQKV